MQFDRESRIAELIARKTAGEITGEEQAMLDEWLAESPEYISAYMRVRSGESMGEYEERVRRLDTDAAIGSIERKIGRQEKRPRRIMWAAGSAAVAFAAVILGMLFYNTDPGINIEHKGYAPLISFNGGEPVALTQDQSGAEWEEYLETAKGTADGGFEGINVRIEIPRGGDLYKLKLHDGSVVWLNSGTVIEYPESFFGERRDVRLDGEAFFKVAEDREKPFIVSAAGNVTVVVLGTSFNITAYGEDRAVATTLVTGSVEMSAPAGSVRLVPGQKAVATEGTDNIIVTEVDPSLVSSWITGVLDFDGEKLSDICARLSRWYNVEFRFEGDSGSKRFSGRAWMDAPLENFLNTMEMVTDVTFTQKQGKIVVTPK